MKSLKLLLLSISISIFLSGCSVLPALLGAVFEPRPEKGWATKSALHKFMNHPKKVLLTDDEKNRASKNICELKHLKKYKNGEGNYKEKALAFCNIKKNSQIYFLKEINTGTGFQETIYFQVIDNKPVRHINIEREYSKELGRSIPIIERLH